MLYSNSRYINSRSMSLTTKDGKTIKYISRRFLPQGENIPTMQLVTVMAGDRIDLISSRTLGDAEQFWKICDANNSIHPLDLTIQPNRVLLIPTPWN